MGIIWDATIAAMRALGIKWAPLSVPLPRRLQTLAAAGWITTMLFGELIGILITLKILYSDYYLVALAYIYWVAKDKDICNTGGRAVQWVRNWSWWTYFRDYFPLKLVKKADLDPERNYLFCVFPHGVLSTGAFASFATNALGFKDLFPGMQPHFLTLGGHFMVPLFREFILSLGLCSASSESLTYLLDRNKGKGKCPILIVGGAAEALNSHPDVYEVILSRRKGFVKIAMKTGTPLVPVLSFGETSLYAPPANPEGGWVRSLQDRFRLATGIAPALPLGRGVLQYSLGVLPQRKPVTTVVGEPLEVERNLDPTPEEVDAVHADFTKRLVKLFEDEKGNCLENSKNVRLVVL